MNVEPETARGPSLAAPRWVDLGAPLLRAPGRIAVLSLGLSCAFAAAAAYLPVPTFSALFLAFGLVLLWKHPRAVVALLIALMANTKVNVYTGSVTIFPEYLVLILAGMIALLRWMENGKAPGERDLLLFFTLFFVAGCLSFVDAVNPSPVFSKAMLIPIAGFVTYLVATRVRSEPELGRALLWLEWSTLIAALYGLLQIIGLFTHWDTSLRFLSRWGNPHMEYGIGPPVVKVGAYIFRANGLFNDPNIFGGFLAAAFAVILALRIHHSGKPETRRRAVAESFLLVVLLLCLLSTMSRTGLLGAFAGGVVVLAFHPRVVRSPRFWAAFAVGLGVVLVLATLLGTRPDILLWRLASSLDPADLSSTTHISVALFALQLIARYPITGVGLGNFGYHYGAELDAHSMRMMSHNAVLTYFAEAGVLGGFAYLVLALAIGRRPWRALRSRGAAESRPALYAATSGLFGALVALFVSNLFYDFLFRTFVWVFAGLAIAAARQWEATSESRPGSQRPRSRGLDESQGTA